MWSEGVLKSLIDWLIKWLIEWLIDFYFFLLINWFLGLPNDWEAPKVPGEGWGWSKLFWYSDQTSTASATSICCPWRSKFGFFLSKCIILKRCLHLKGVFAKNERGYRLNAIKKTLLIATNLTFTCCVYKEKIVKDVSYRIT